MTNLSSTGEVRPTTKQLQNALHEQAPRLEAPMTTQSARRALSHRLPLVVAASLIVGLLLPVVLALGPAAGGGESRMTGAALLGWGIGWALIALLSTRFTDDRQPWALGGASRAGIREPLHQ